ncbi:iron complex transport system substrate-binding protein [Lachnotalea glycerini]|uniref:Iron complex transport system substrate-binding protein n=1 Tax=Lachnotalea glycerini TaxID=1763509 RepID=A0A318EPN4_9FIRM|nr:ABC transporter substrate-binding protein [Lachnotalea glycerini]PXV93435.1 iron complex transport system substrate-binding protein [Lachnotalea glycerini]
MKRKKLHLVFVIVISLSLLFGCTKKSDSETKESTKETSETQDSEAQTAKETKETASEETKQTKTNLSDTVTFVDSAGREVEVPEEITRIAPSGTMAQIVTFALAPDELVGLSGKWATDANLILEQKYLDLPVFGQFYGSGDLNKEAIAAANPQVIIDIGEYKDSIVEDMDTIMQQLGIPTIFIEATTEGTGDAYRMLGKLLNKEEEAEEIAAYCDDVYSKTKTVMESIGDDKKTLAYCLGDTGLNVIAEGSFHAEVINLLAKNVAVVEEPSAKGSGNEISMEQLMMWDPDYIIFAPGSIYESVGEDSAWQGLSAIKNGNYCEAPSIPYNWLGFPPSVNRYIGMIWMSELLYPEQFDYNLFEETARYYKMFYHCDLSEEVFNQITQNAKFK